MIFFNSKSTFFNVGERCSAFYIARSNCYYLYLKLLVEMYIYKNIITLEPEKRGGKPCIRGLRITVEDILRWLASGMTFEDILSDFPDLTRDDIIAALEFSADQHKRTLYAA
jgi:uncharacterized protein (DUF433 family)